MKKKIIYVILSLVLCMGGSACSNQVGEETLFDSSEQLPTIENSVNEEVPEISYKEVSLDKIGEYEFAASTYNEFKTVERELNYINIGEGVTFDFTKGDWKPYRFDAEDEIQFWGCTVSYIEDGDGIYNDEDAVILDASFLQEFIEDSDEAVFIRNGSGSSHYACIYKGNYTLRIYASREDEEEAKNIIIKALSYLSSEYKEDALNAKEYGDEIGKTFSVDAVDLDLSSCNVGMGSVYFHIDENGCYTAYLEPQIWITGPDEKSKIAFSFNATTKQDEKTLLNNCKDAVEKADSMYEIYLSTMTVRVYQHGENINYLGFVVDDVEYLQSITTKMSIEDLASFLECIIRE